MSPSTILSLYLVSHRETFFRRVLEINTGLICSCTLALKPFVKHLASKVRSQGSRLNPKGNVPLGRLTDTGTLRQNTAGMGFVAALGNEDVEMKISRSGILEAEHII